MWFLFFVFLNLVEGEVINLIKDNSLTCVLTGESVYSGLYLADKNTVLPFSTERLQLFELDQWYHKDWKIGSTNKFLYYPLKDIRWEGFSIQNGGKIKIPQAFSLCLSENFFFSEGFHSFGARLHLIPFQKLSKKHCTWVHYILEGNNISQIDGEERKTVAIIDQRTERISFTNIPLKIHQYNFMYWNFTTIVDKVDYLKVTTPDNSSGLCIAMFVSIDKNCFLDVILETENATSQQRIDGFNEENNPKKWKLIKIESSNYRGFGKLHFYRSRSDHVKTGYWAIDKIHICKLDPDVYKKQLSSSNKNFKCTSLHSHRPEKICLRDGFLGNNCTISCNHILGGSYKYCEQQKICLETEACYCSWGYKGNYCNLTCKNGLYGLNCSSTFNINHCEKFNTIIGCVKCKKEFFGKQCAEALPVATKVSTLTEIDEKWIKIDLTNVTYGKTQAKAEFYQIQYKQSNSKAFVNFTLPLPLPLPQTVKITDLNTRNFAYIVRVLFIVKNLSLKENIPELYIHKRNFHVQLTNKQLELNWSNTSSESYTINYTCQSNICKSSAIAGSVSTSNSSLTLHNFGFKKFSYCIFKLFDRGYDLVDTTKYLNPNKNFVKAELPRQIIFSKKVVSLFFESCENFNEPITYVINYACASEWCPSKTKQSLKIEFLTYKEILNKTVNDIMPFTDYMVEIIGYKNGINISYLLETQSLPDKPKPIKNLVVYSSTENSVWLRWKYHYPPTGVSKVYVSLQEEETGKIYSSNFSFPCTIWESYYCCNITGLQKAAYYKLNVFTQNINVSEKSEVVSAQVSTKKAITEAVPNLKMPFVSPSKKITLAWNHPYYTYGNVTKFVIKINSREYTRVIQEPRETYKQEIEIKENETFLDVKVAAQYGKESSLTATILFLVSRHSAQYSYFIIEWCSTDCFLLLPEKMKHFEIMAIKKENTNIRKSYNKIKTKKLPVEEGWIVKNKTEDGTFNIGTKAFQAVSATDSNYDMYFISNNTFYKVQFPEIVTKTGSIYTIYIILFFLTTVAITAVYYIRKRSEKTLQNSQNAEDECEETLILSDVNCMSTSQTIRVDGLEEYLKDCLLKDNRLSYQFKSLPNEKFKSCSVALKEENAIKNRDQIHIPYDISRVILNKLEGVGTSDYINASYIDGFDRPRAYILSQSPKFSTVSDFWRMVWQEKVEFIVMATNLMEGEYRMCADYWNPSLNKSCEYGNLSIKMISEKLYQSYDQHIFEICYKNITRKIEHFQLKWFSSRRQSFYPNDILPVIKYIDLVSEKCSSPILFHSSLGADRSATLVLCNLALEMAKSTGTVNFFQLLSTIREQRPLTVNTAEHYVLAHFTVLEYFLEKESPFNKSVDIILHNNSMIEQQLVYSNKVYWSDAIIQSLEPTTGEQEKTIWSCVDGYRGNRQFFLCEHPKQNRSEFWQMVIKKNIQCIVCLKDFKNKMWPYKFQNTQFSFQISQYNEATVTKYSSITEIILIIYEKDKKILHKNEILFINLNEWAPVYSSTSTLSILSVMHDIKKINQKDQRNILITGNDSLTTNILFIIIFSVIERYENELEIDVCSALRVVKRSEPRFILQVHHLHYIYAVIYDFFKNFDQYKHVYSKSA